MEEALANIREAIKLYLEPVESGNVNWATVRPPNAYSADTGPHAACARSRFNSNRFGWPSAHAV